MDQPLIFDKYEVLNRIAVGGMGEIFLARQHGVAGFDRLVILKSLLPDLAEQPGFVEQFFDEARLLATLNHPNIVSIYEVGAWKGIYYIAMEYIAGETLAVLLRASLVTGTPLTYPVMARIVHDAALGLDHAHKACDSQNRNLGIVHRDVTPQNLMVRTDGVTKVVDFGIAMGALRSTRTASGVLKGKLPYMPPEQLQHGELDARADQWSLGVVLWECLARRVLFDTTNEVDTMVAVLHKKIPKPSSVVPDIPPELEDVAMRMLERKREDRYESLQEVADDLRVYMDAASAEATPAAVAAFVQQAAGERIRSKTPAAASKPRGDFLFALTPKGTSLQPKGSPAPAEPEPAEPPSSSGKRVGLLLGAAVALLAAGGVAVWGPWRAAAPLEDEADAAAAVAPDAARRRPGPDAAAPGPDAAPPTPPEPPTAALISSEPSGARVYLSNRLIGETPLRLDTLPPDTEQQLVVEKDGFAQEIARVKLVRGETTEVNVKLRKGAGKPKPRTQPPPPPANAQADAKEGFLSLNTTPWTEVTIAGQPFGTTPLFRIKLAPGSHVVELVNGEEGIRQKRTVAIKAGETTKLDLVLK
ncbi:MAG TPA: serine/threonine-protein kinase [Myxococcales bacterium]|jgi:serine/threonine protein kinase